LKFEILRGPALTPVYHIVAETYEGLRTSGDRFGDVAAREDLKFEI
jgi:hypothetical protein